MEGTGGEQHTNTFRFKHHAMPIPTITSTDRIVAATHILTDAITGIQEAPPDKMQAILTLRQLPLGETPPVPVPIDPPASPSPSSTVAPTTLTQLDVMDDRSIHMWDPRQIPQHAPTQQHHTTTPTNDNYLTPVAIIEDNATPTQTTSHSIPQCQTHAQHRTAYVHLINSTITKALMPLTGFKPTCKYLTHGYIATTQAPLVQTYGINPTTASQPNTVSINFISSIIDDHQKCKAR
jgi:hypothetical protein